MKVVVVCVGRPRGALAEVVAEYEARGRRYWKLEAVEVASGAGGKSGAVDVRAAEGERLLARVPEGLDVVALTRGGKPMGSDELARYLEDKAVHAHPGVAFVVGGAHGLSPDVLSRADRCLTLSAMTLPHEMARLVLAEQLYRAGTILRGEPYHKA